MILEHLCDMELGYKDQFQLIKPFGGEEGSGYGEGEGVATGEKLAGTIKWANHPHRRSDGRMLPDAAGIVITSNGAKVTFRMQGRTTFRTNDKGERKGGQLLWITFESDDEAYKWLNDALGVIEGVIDAKTLRMKFAVYTCVNELIA